MAVPDSKVVWLVVRFIYLKVRIPSTKQKDR